MGEALRRGARRGREGGNALEGATWGERLGRRVRRALKRLACGALAATLVAPAAAQSGAVQLREGRFTVVADPANAALARSLLAEALRTDTFPGLRRPTARVSLVIASDAGHFRALIGPSVPEWGSAVAFPHANRIVMQGRRAGSRAGDPFEVLRHELAHLALHEAIGDLSPRWFDEGYASFAAREWSREDALRANLALAVRGTPTLLELERWFEGGATRAEAAYALAYRAVVELAELDPERGLNVLFVEWARTGKLDTAVRNAYGLTLAGFETRWRSRTRRRYGGLAIIADVTIAGLFVFVVIMPLYAARRRRDRRRMIALRAADEAADRAAHDSALEFLLRPAKANGGPATPGDGPAAGPGDTR
jgi:hypothetical protein